MAAGSTYTPIATTTLANSTTASYTFSSIPSTYTDLILIGAGQLTVNGEGLGVRFNADSGSNYSFTYLSGNGTSAASGRQTGTTYATSNWNTGFSNSTDNNTIFHIQNYANSTTYKTVLARSNNAAGSSNPGTETVVNLWRNTSAITSILVKANTGYFTTGFTWTLYGIAAA
jgi:hypothetical protein